MRTNIELDDDLMTQALKLSKIKTKREVIQEALKNYVAWMKKKQLLGLKGKVLYRLLRKKGLTIRKSNDCLIAFYAIEFSIPLVHADSDFDTISKHSKLEILDARIA